MLLVRSRRCHRAVFPAAGFRYPRVTLPIFRLNERLVFPDPFLADERSGILAVGGDLSPRRLLLAYSQGIFPWYDEAESPILWHSPLWRMVLRPADLHVGRTTEKWIRRGTYTLRYDHAWPEVIARCATVPRPGQDGTWLNRDMARAYTRLFEQGHAHSAEAWRDGKLVGGLYGVTLGGVFFGESMFSLEPNASKVVFCSLVPALAALGYTLVDCQVYTEHLARFGATEWPKARFQAALAAGLRVQPAQVWPRTAGPADPS